MTKSSPKFGGPQQISRVQFFWTT